MATMKWAKDGCRIIKLNAGDIYIDETDREYHIPAIQYLLVTGPAISRIREYNKDYNRVSVMFPSNARLEDKLITLLAYKPDPYEWWDVICRNLPSYNTLPTIAEIEIALDQCESDSEEESM